MGKKKHRKSRRNGTNGATAVMPDNYRGASRGIRSMRNYSPPLLSPTQELNETVRVEATARTRDLAKNSPMARACLDRPVDFTVGKGLRVNAKPNAHILSISRDKAEELTRDIEENFNLYAESEDIDVLRISNFAELQWIAMSTAFTSGDCFAFTPSIEFPGCSYKTKLKLIEGEQVSNPAGRINSQWLHDGIEIDDNGTPVFYHVREGYPTDYLSGKSFQWGVYPIFGEKTGYRRAMQVYTRRRPGQYRGEVLLMPVIEKIHQVTQYDRAEVTAALINSIFTVFRKLDQAPDDPNELVNLQNGGSSVIPEMPALGAGIFTDLFGGKEELEFADPNRPNVNYQAFLDGITKQVGAAIGIPAEEILLKYDSSYSAARAAMLRAWNWYTMRRKWLGSRLLTPFYRVWFAEAVTLGIIDAPGFFTDPRKRAAYTQCAWIGPAKGHVDELKEAQSATERLRNLTTTHEHECAQQGLDFWSEVLPKVKREHEALRSAGIALDVSPAAAIQITEKANA